jgi:D-tyrosyl-tRNA(Tyr) deacylase
MRLVIQRVSEAKVVIGEKVHSAIGPGLVILLGIHKNDTVQACNALAEKLVNLRIFADAEGKMNLSVQDVKGSILIVSQFTLYADCTKGRRPSFVEAASPEIAVPIYEKFLKCVSQLWPQTCAGVFGADMKVHLVNDGPLTFLLG